jgi:hypothetical protein
VRDADGLGEQAGECVGRMNRLPDIATSCQDDFARREPFYREFLVPFPPWEAVFPLEMAPCALALCLIARGDAEQALLGCANFGRDADTIATIGGAIAGALRGAEALPAAWVSAVRAATPVDQDELTTSLLAVLRRRADDAAAWGTRVERMLGAMAAPEA